MANRSLTRRDFSRSSMVPFLSALRSASAYKVVGHLPFCTTSPLLHIIVP